MRKAVVLLSGGMDSSTLVHYVRRKLDVEEIHALTFVYGQKHAREREAAGWQAAAAQTYAHHTVDMTFFAALIKGGGSALIDEAISVPDLADLSAAQRDQPPTYVPNRNTVLLSLAAAYAEARSITSVFYGAQIQDQYGYWDCTSTYLARLNELLLLNRRRPVGVHAPFLTMRKAEILRIGIELGVDYGRTWSCYRGHAPACGTCPTCVERLQAFREVGQPDPLPYAAR